MGRPLFLLALFLGLVGNSSPARATSLIVPDQIPTIQAAIDAVVDTIIIRSGVYPETLVVRQQFSLMTGSDDAGGPPEIGGLDFSGAGNLLYEFRGLEFTSNLLIVGEYRVKFDDCAIPRINSTVVWSSLLRCHIGAYSGMDVADSAIVDSCHLVGGLSSNGAYFVVRGCTVEAPGFGFNSQSKSVYIDGNTIRGTLSGVALDNSDSTMVTNNVIEDCERYGIYDSGNYKKTIANNVIRRCHEGMQFENGEIFLIGNTVADSEQSGVILHSRAREISGNVVYGSGYYGITISGGESGGMKINHNTIALNGYAGIEVETSGDNDECIGNIGYGNSTGVRWDVAPNATFACNDWFGNATNIADREPFATEFSVDPEFCDPENGDFRLRPTSPLLDWPGCGRVGALGACEPTATLVQRFDAQRVSDGVRVVWQIAPGATASKVWLERADVGEIWVRPVTDRSSEVGAIVELDRSADSDREYRYRLMAREGADVTLIGAEIRIEAVAKSGFELISVGPSPGVGPVRIAFSLARAAAIQVDVFDVLGRTVASPARGTWPAGAHEVQWNGLVREEKARPGLYLIRYTHPGGTDTKRLVRIP